MNPPPPPTTAPAGELVSVDGRSLPLVGTSLEVEARGGLGRVVLKQRFVNRYDEPLSVRYQVPLPADGAVSGFAFELDGRRTVGVVERKVVARQRYEEAIVAGHSAALLEQQRSSLFSQEVGTSRPAPRSSPSSWWIRSSAGSPRGAGSGASPPWWRRATWAPRVA